VREAARLVPGLEWLGSVRVRPTATLVVSLDSPLRTGWFGLSVPRVEEPGAVLSAVCVQEEKGTGVVGDGRGALVAMPAPPRAEWWASAAPGDVLSEALPALATLLPGIRSRIVEARLVRLPGGAFIPEPGHFDRLRRRETDLLPPRVALAGDYLVAPTVEGAVRSGLNAAEAVSRAGW